MNVNLLPNKSRLEFRKLKIISLVKKGSYFFVGLFLIISLATFSLNLYYSTNLKKNQSGLASAQSQYSQYVDKIDELQSLRFRVKMVAEVLARRQTVSGNIDDIKRIIGSETTITRMKIDNKKAEITAIASSYKDLSLIEEIMKKEEKNDQTLFSEINFKNLGQEENGGWLFSCEFTFKDET
jgi:Tfp pilus assembly protein PilN